MEGFVAELMVFVNWVVKVCDISLDVGFEGQVD